MKNIKFKAEYKKSVNHPGPTKVYVDDRLLGRDNKYPSLIDLMKQNKDTSYEQLLVKENLVSHKLVIDRSEFKQTAKDTLKQIKRAYKYAVRNNTLTNEISKTFVDIIMKTGHKPYGLCFKFN